MAGISHRYQSPPSRPTDEIEDWPTVEPIDPRWLPKLQVSSGMERTSQFSFQSHALEQEWPTDDELEGRFLDARSSPSSTTLDRDMSTTGTEESGTDETGITSPDGSQGPVIDLTISDVIVDRTINNVIDLTDDMEIDEPSGSGLRPSMSVELVDGSYLRIEKIFREDGEEFLRGRYLLKTTDQRVSAYVPKVHGELVWVTTLVGHVPVEHVKRTREIHFTNARSNWQSHSNLLCRLKFAENLRTSTTTRRHERVYEPERSVEYLAFEETDEGYGWTSMELRNDWRGSTTPFGEAERPPTPSPALTSGPVVIDLTDNTELPIDLTGARDRAYTFGDAFCGAGGTSCGARQAGLSVRWGSDRDKHAVETYELNFDADVYHASFDQLMAMPASELRADVVHCSPPCQPFSPAHTVNNQLNDEQNSACIFAARNLLQLARPRILTMEETAGLQERHSETLQRVILDIVEEGCSVRWSVLDTFHYGVPQCRKRLVLIAAGPGERLPNLPPGTHGLPGEGLLRPATIHDAIHDIPEGTLDHDVDKALGAWKRQGHHAPYNAYTQAKTITCAGGEANYHPSGLRPFTPREVACLQTFPLTFQFSAKNVRKQVGNAVPPKFAEAIYREIARSLRETDEKLLWEQEQREQQRRAAW